MLLSPVARQREILDIFNLLIGPSDHDFQKMSDHFLYTWKHTDTIYVKKHWSKDGVSVGHQSQYIKANVPIGLWINFIKY